MKVVLLCAGYAKRLAPLTDNQPKPLLPVNGRPMIEYILDRLEPIRAVDGIIVVTNHKFAGHFEKWAGKLKCPWPIDILDDQTTSNETRLGAIGDLKFTTEKKGLGQEDVLVVAGDNLFDFDLITFMRLAEKKRPHAVLAVYDVKEIERAKQYGLVRLAEGEKVVEFFEKPEKPSTTLASCGIYWLPRETSVLLDRYLKDGHNADQPGHYMRWLAETDCLYGISLQGCWYDIGDLKSYQEADKLFREIYKKKP